MAYSALTFTASEVPTLTKWNQLWANDAAMADGTGIANNAILTRHILNANITPAKWTNPYKFSAYGNTSPSITNTTQKVVLNLKQFDSNSNFDNVTNYRYTVPLTGFYFLNAQTWVGSAGAGTTENATCQIYKNGSVLRESDRINGNGDANRLMRPKVSAFVSLTAGDYIELFVAFTGSRDVVGSNASTFLEGFLVTPT